MSGAFKAVTKVFKPVVKVIKKAAPFILAAAALYFTGGALLGLTPGFGAAAGGFVGNTLGITGTLGNIMTGAITGAGYGSLTGGLTSLVSGGNFLKGMQTGALGGALTGGVLSGIGLGPGALAGGDTATGMGTGAGLFPDASGAEALANQTLTPGGLPAPSDISSTVQSGAQGSGNIIGSNAPKNGLLANTVTGPDPAANLNLTGKAPATGVTGTSGGTAAPTGFIERNQELLGRVGAGAVEGLGKGLLAGGGEDRVESINAEYDRRAVELRQKQGLVAANYGSGGNGLLVPSSGGGGSFSSAAAPPRPGTVTNGGTWMWDAAFGRSIFVPNA